MLSRGKYFFRSDFWNKHEGEWRACIGGAHKKEANMGGYGGFFIKNDKAFRRYFDNDKKIYDSEELTDELLYCLGCRFYIVEGTTIREFFTSLLPIRGALSDIFKLIAVRLRA